MNSKKINITIPEKILGEINEFCEEEGMTKSLLIREAAISYIAAIREKKEIERKRKEIEWAIKTSKSIRQKMGRFKDNKKGSKIIREFRDRDH